MKIENFNLSRIIDLDKKKYRDATNLVVTSRLFKDAKRSEAFTFLYTFMRTVDDLVDQVAEKALSDDEKACIRSEVEYYQGVALEGRNTSSDIADQFNEISERFKITLDLWKNFFSAMWKDFYLRYPQDLNEFLDYAEGASVAATTIYLILIASEKNKDGCYDLKQFDAITTGRNLGIWAYTIHIARDLKSDIQASQKSRLLIPLDHIISCGMTVDNLTWQSNQNILDSQGRKMVLDFLDIGDFYGREGKRQAAELGKLLPLHLFRILGLIVAIYSEIDRRIKSRNGDVFDAAPIFTSSERFQYAKDVLKSKSWQEMVEYW